MLSVSPFYPLNELTDFHESGYEYYATEGHSILIPSSFLKSLMMWWIHNLVEVGNALPPLYIYGHETEW
jgi:hypothetical protein